MSRNPFAAGLLALATVVAPAAAQAPGSGHASGAAVRGTVVDAEGGMPVAGVDVRLVGPETLGATTDGQGRWLVPAAAPGSYAVALSRIGFQDQVMHVTLPAASEVRVSMRAWALPLNALVVTASRRSQRLADAPVAMEVVRAEEIRRSGASDVAAVLTERTGIQLQGGHPNGAGVMLQGLDSERVLVLVDGRPWVGRISGTADLSRIPTSSVERIEVVKGPQATLYGSEAMGGVVNIITRRPEGAWTAAGTLTSGSQDRLDASLRLDGRRGPLTFGLEGGRRAEELIPGHAAAGDASVVRRDGRGRVAWSPDGREPREVGAEARLLVVDEDQRWRSGQLRQFGDNVQGALTLEGRWAGAEHTLSMTFHGSRFDHLLRRGTRDAAPPEGSGERQVQQLTQLDALWGWHRGDALLLDMGVEVARESIDAETVNSRDSRRTEVEPFAQATLALGAVSLVPGLRFTHSTRWGGHWTPRLAIMMRPVPSLAIRASAAGGYRAPSFKELGLDFLNTGPGFGYLVRGNPELGAETSRNLSIGVEWSGARAYARVQTFHNAFTDFIETRAVADSAGITLYTYGNIARGSTAGVESEVGTSLGPLDLELGHAWLLTEDASTGDPLLGRPAHSGRASISLPLGPLGVHVAGTWTGSTPLSRDAETGLTVYRDAFHRLDTRASYRLGDRLRVALGVDNVLNRIPRQWPGFAGRRMHITLDTTFFGTQTP